MQKKDLQIDRSFFVQISVGSPIVTPEANYEQKLRELSQKLEATFLAEMLKSAGLERQENGFSSSVGESQFTSFLTQERAEILAGNGGIGLSQHIFNSLIAAEKRDHG